MKRILFVDDDAKVLDGLRRMLYPLRADWQMSFAGGGVEALKLMAHDTVDILVTDIRMPEMDGIELLSRVRDLHPEVVRIILSGQADRDLTLRSAATAHQYLSKPCDAQMLKLTIARASALKDVLSDPSLRALVSSGKALPSVPALYTKLLQELESPDSSIDDIAKVIASDTGMTAKILQLANSAFFGIRQRIVGPKDAVLYLGFDTVKALALTVKVFSEFAGASCSRFSVSSLAQHCVLTGTLARRLAKAIDLSSQNVEEAFMAGLLHDVGKLLLVDAFPAKYDQAMRAAETQGSTGWEAERTVFGTTHAEVGTYLLWLWGLPDAVVEAVAYHHAPSMCPAQHASPLTAVHMANVLSHTGGLESGQAAEVDFDHSYIERLGLPANWSTWQSFGEALQQQETR